MNGVCAVVAEGALAHQGTSCRREAPCRSDGLRVAVFRALRAERECPATLPRGEPCARPRRDQLGLFSCSDDEDVAPLSAKFADIYPLSNYADAEVVAHMNGTHGELNGGGENMALKDEVRPGPPGWRWAGVCGLAFLLLCPEVCNLLFPQSPQVSSTSSSSSEADDEEADGESSGEPPGAPKEDGALESGSPGGEESKGDSPPPSHPAPQVWLHVSRLSICQGLLPLYVFSKRSIVKYKIVSF